jgi:hypothetical protein
MAKVTERSVFLPCGSGLLIKRPLQGDLTPHLGKHVFLTKVLENSDNKSVSGKLLIVSKYYLGVSRLMGGWDTASLGSQIAHITQPYYVGDLSQHVSWCLLEWAKVEILFSGN